MINDGVKYFLNLKSENEDKKRVRTLRITVNPSFIYYNIKRYGRQREEKLKKRFCCFQHRTHAAYVSSINCKKLTSF